MMLARTVSEPFQMMNAVHANAAGLGTYYLPHRLTGCTCLCLEQLQNEVDTLRLRRESASASITPLIPMTTCTRRAPQIGDNGRTSKAESYSAGGRVCSRACCLNVLSPRKQRRLCLPAICKTNFVPCAPQESAQFSAMATELSDRDTVGTALTLQMALGFSVTVVAIFAISLVEVRRRTFFFARLKNQKSMHFTTRVHTYAAILTSFVLRYGHKVPTISGVYSCSIE